MGLKRAFNFQLGRLKAYRLPRAFQGNSAALIRLKQIRACGLRGVWNYLLRMRHELAARRFLIANARQCGGLKPVRGNTDFCKEETAFLVDYKMVPNQSEDEVYRSVKKWPEPSVECAAKHLRIICDNPDMGRAKSASALTFIREYFSTANFEMDVRKFCEATR